PTLTTVFKSKAKICKSIFFILLIFYVSNPLYSLFSFLIASPEPIKEDQKRLLQQEAGLDAIVNTELLRIAKANKICYESENNVAGCSNEILSDLLVFHAYDGVYPIWELGNAFTSRVATRVKSRIHGELLTMIQMLLPGTSMVYYGEEIGLKDSES